MRIIKYIIFSTPVGSQVGIVLVSAKLCQIRMYWQFNSRSVL